ncbi:hypothetical protein GT347_07755 [Xylophilus rhododendri]|uniref:Uncharacterized protein n=1 Tax=Xylophilus rhododendri TaxID=2697032 RepID=A0A857J4V7_9BURK|nr:hypothetical protein [Xylophilus rhododendri]QHI97898.1 hypothetical protein GT347_07755 [Xylophilus rhododendri]
MKKKALEIAADPVPSAVGAWKSGMLDAMEGAQQLAQSSQTQQQQWLQDAAQAAQLPSLLRYCEQLGETEQRLRTGISAWLHQLPALALENQLNLGRTLLEARGTSDALLAFNLQGQALQTQWQAHLEKLQALANGAGPGFLACWRQYLQDTPEASV